MGLDFSVAEEKTTVNAPLWGLTQLNNLVELIDMAGKVTDRHVREAMYDSINHRYRSSTYRKHIESMLAGGHISKQQVIDMQHALAPIRRARRTPDAKAWRWQWP